MLLIGDVVGAPGRKAVAEALPGLKSETGAEFVMANVENLAGGFGVNEKALAELQAAGVDAFSSGNHIWDKKEVEACWEKFPTLLRPLNYPAAAPGRSELLFTTPSGVPVGLINPMGRVFMSSPVDDPFSAAKQACARLRAQGARVIVVDMHAEASSEKVALWRHLDGECTVVAGTHTHVPTADARISPKGTAYVTDLGMCGGYGGIIGVKPDTILRKFLLGLPARHEPSDEDLEFWALLVEADEVTGRAIRLEQIRKVLSKKIN